MPLRRSRRSSPPPVPALLVTVVAVQSEGELVQAALTTVIAGTVGVAGAALLRWPRWAGVGAVLAIGGVVGALIAVARRFVLARRS